MINKQSIKYLARKLRKEQTGEENLLWLNLKNRKFEGLKFLRQHPIIYEYYKRPYFFIADFFCFEKKLVVELDGKIHENQKEYDEQRDYIINNMGYRVLRIKNEELNNMSFVLNKIKEYCQ